MTPLPTAAFKVTPEILPSSNHAHLLDSQHEAEAVNGEPDHPFQVILSFDVEEHYRIEAASGLEIDSSLKCHYRERLRVSTHWVLEKLAERDIKATFFIVGRIARHDPGLVRAIHRDGHEIASHSWDHKRVHNFKPRTFREDVLRSKDTLEQLTGEPVVGFRAPTFSIVRKTAWAIDVLAELGMAYDSSIYPIAHDRYGVPRAPRVPFMAQGNEHSLLELPPATLRLLRTNIPVGGGGYFRLFPMFLMRLAFSQVRKYTEAPVAMLYFHPWEFDPDQARLPLSRFSRFRTYVGLLKNQSRLGCLLAGNEFVQARGVVGRLCKNRRNLSAYRVGEPKQANHVKSYYA